MAKIEKEIGLESMLIDKEFLKQLNSIISDCNQRNIKLKKEINIYVDGERTTFTDFEDFLKSSNIFDRPKSLSFRIAAANHKDKKEIIGIYFRINNREKRNYYELTSYDEGKLLACEKKIKLLLNRYKNWYHLIFKIPVYDEAVPFFVSLSLGILTYRFLAILSFILEDNTRTIIAVILFFVYFNYSSKAFNNLFPIMDLRFFDTNRNKFWRNFSVAVILGLIGNLVWAIINYLTNN